MIIDDVRFELKDGREAILRSPKEEDVESTLEYLVTSAGELIIFCVIRRSVENIQQKEKKRCLSRRMPLQMKQ